MLVLTRLKDEGIMIGDDIEITVVEVRGDRVRLGIRAPQSVPVHRKEVYLAIQEANVEASRADAGGIRRLGEIAKIIAPRPPASGSPSPTGKPSIIRGDPERGSAPPQK